MSRFSVGEIAIIAKSDRAEFTVGSEVTILDVMPVGHYANIIFAEQIYQISGPDSGRYFIRQSGLRKKRPPQDWQKLCKLDRIPTVTEECA